VLSIQVRFHDFGLPIFKVFEHLLWRLEVQTRFHLLECFSFSFDVELTVIFDSNSFSFFIFTEELLFVDLPELPEGVAVKELGVLCLDLLLVEVWVFAVSEFFGFQVFQNGSWVFVVGFVDAIGSSGVVDVFACVLGRDHE
jgi:hypothetical protein